jgi:hypothetical protein
MDGEKIGTSAVTSYISKTGFLVAQNKLKLEQVITFPADIA